MDKRALGERKIRTGLLEFVSYEYILIVLETISPLQLQLFPSGGQKQDYQCIEMLFLIRIWSSCIQRLLRYQLRPWHLFSCIIELFDFFPYPKEEKSTNKTLNWIKNDKFDFADENRTYQRPIYAFSVKL